MAHDHIHTDYWKLQLPPDWVQLESPEEGLWYFESGDGEKGLYVLTWQLGDGAARSAEEVAEAFAEQDRENLNNMAGYQWQIRAQHGQPWVDGSSATLGDAYDRQHHYRIISRILARPPVVVRASFHDYACTDPEASGQYFAPLIDSFQLVTRHS